MTSTTETHCHCGRAWQQYGSDHCDACGCEQYEGHCDHVDDGEDDLPAFVSRRPQDGQTSTLSVAQWRSMVQFFAHDIPLGHPNRVRVLQYQTTTPPSTHR